MVYSAALSLLLMIRALLCLVYVLVSEVFKVVVLPNVSFVYFQEEVVVFVELGYYNISSATWLCC